MRDSSSEIEALRAVVEGLCHRTRMMVIGGTFEEVCAFLSGYARGREAGPMSGEAWSLWNSYVNLRVGFPDNYAWAASLRRSFPEDDAAIRCLKSFVDDYLDRWNAVGPEQLLEGVEGPEAHEGEPERVVRALLRAILDADEASVRSAILDHPDAAVLWENGPYPHDVAETLWSVWEEQRLTRLVHESTEDRVALLCPPMLAEIYVERTDGGWRVDASDLIRRRRSMR